MFTHIFVNTLQLITNIYVLLYLNSLEECKDMAEFCTYGVKCEMEEVRLTCPKLCGECVPIGKLIFLVTFISIKAI